MGTADPPGRGDARLPLGWWHPVTAIDFGVTVTYTNFQWPNDSFGSYPRG